MELFDGPLGGPAGSVPPPGTGGPSVDPAALEPVLEDAQVWGVELDTGFRVLALTVEPTSQRYPWGDVEDRRVQLLCHPVSTVLAALRRDADEEPALLEFTAEQLVDVASALGGARLRGPVFGRPEPRPGQWGPRFSLQGRSSAPDGTATTLTLDLTEDDLTLQLFARFDTATVTAPDGSPLTLDAAQEG